jgi:CheY-like chemotaxis protein
MQKEYSTGEVSELLSISRVTVSRKFDSGDFSGRKNPITGERHISRDSLLEFMRKFNITHPEITETTRKRVIVCSPDENIQSVVANLVADKPIDLLSTSYGADTLVSCSRDLPDIIIIDEEVSDVSCLEIIKYLKRMNGIDATKIISLTNSEIIADDDYRRRDTFADIANCDFISKQNLSSEILRDRLDLLIQDISDQDTVLGNYEHNREHPRIALRMPVEIEVYRVESPDVRDRGSAVLGNISAGGCFIESITLESNQFPSDPFRMIVTMHTPPLSDWSADAMVVRLRSNGNLSSGLMFHDLTDRSRQRLDAVIDSHTP